MSPTNFPEATITLGAPPDHVPNAEVGEIGGLPVHTTGLQCISCWRMTWRERLSALLFGRVWLAVFSGRTQPPVYVQASRRYFRTIPAPDFQTMKQRAP